MDTQESRVCKHKFNCEKEYIECILTYIARISEQDGFSPRQINDILTATREALVNIKNHAYEGKTNKPVQLNCYRYKQKIEIEIRDYGKQFLKTVTDRSPIEDIAQTGLGIYVMEKSMDAVSFSSSTQSGTLLKMTKFLSKRKSGRV